MADIDFIAGSAGIVRTDQDRAAADPRLRRITTHDLLDSLARGWADFKAQPSHLVFIALIYPIAGVLLAQLTVSYNVFPLLFPLLGGFALLGPFAAIGLYEVSRRRERGESARWSDAMRVFSSPAIGAILTLGLMLTGLFLAWLCSAWLIYQSLLGPDGPVTAEVFLTQALTTFDGWVMIVVGNSVGLLFAILAFSISIVAFPLMIDRGTDVGTAVKTSLAAVEHNPREMMIWGLMVTGLLVLGSLPMLVGLVVVMPVLGHATWHLYRKMIA